jgi:hypothetical protein
MRRRLGSLRRPRRAARVSFRLQMTAEAQARRRRCSIVATWRARAPGSTNEWRAQTRRPQLQRRHGQAPNSQAAHACTCAQSRTRAPAVSAQRAAGKQSGCAPAPQRKPASRCQPATGAVGARESRATARGGRSAARRAKLARQRRVGTLRHEEARSRTTHRNRSRRAPRDGSSRWWQRGRTRTSSARLVHTTSAALPEATARG